MSWWLYVCLEMGVKLGLKIQELFKDYLCYEGPFLIPCVTETSFFLPQEKTGGVISGKRKMEDSELDNRQN